ncbi:hypothetical protein RZN22_01250 [Bacillaceae bacterium S4-13-58]
MVNMDYDAKEKQVCKLCGFEINHNKHGWFTSHLKDAHGISLEEYFFIRESNWSVKMNYVTI